MKVPLVTLNPSWMGAGGEGIYQLTGRPCPTCPAGAPVRECRACFGSGNEYEQAPQRHGIGLMFDCVCPVCSAKRTGDRDHDWYLRHFVPFTNPLDGGAPFDAKRPCWTRTGETFETLCLSPSILSDTAKGGCGWHGFIGMAGAGPGEVITC